MAAATWLADVLRRAGCTVVEEGNWKARSAGSTFTPKGIILHHDATSPGPSPGVVDMLINGRSDVPGPLCQLWLDYYGKWHTIAAGRANHAGSGGPWGVFPAESGNTYAIGIECDHTTGEVWTAAQRAEGEKGMAAIMDYLGADPANALCGHKEWAPTRKVDPDPANMANVRREVAAYVPGSGTPEEEPPTMFELCKDANGNSWMFAPGLVRQITDSNDWNALKGSPLCISDSRTISVDGRDRYKRLFLGTPQ